MKYKHYAPKADLTLVEPGTGADRNTGAAPETGLDETQLQAMIRKVRELSREKIEAGYKVGVICTDESRGCYTAVSYTHLDVYKRQGLETAQYQPCGETGA